MARRAGRIVGSFRPPRVERRRRRGRRSATGRPRPIVPTRAVAIGRSPGRRRDREPWHAAAPIGRGGAAVSASSSPSRWPTAGPPAPTDPRPPAGRPGRLRTATRPSRVRPRVRHAGRPAVRGSRSRRHQPEIGAASRRPEGQDIGLSPAVGARQLVDLAEDPSRVPVDLLDHDGRRIEQHASTPSRRRDRWPRATAPRRGRDRPCGAWPPREAPAKSTPVAGPCSVRGSRRQDRRRRAQPRCRCCRAA